MTLIQLYEFLEEKSFEEEMSKWTANVKGKYRKSRFLRFWFENKWETQPLYKIGPFNILVKCMDGDYSEESFHPPYYEICLVTPHNSNFTCVIGEEAEEFHQDLSLLKLIIYETSVPLKSNNKTATKNKEKI